MLLDGPWRSRTYWRTELEAMQEASRRMGYPDHHTSAELRNYHPGEELAARADFPGHVVRAWRFHAPAEPPATS